MASITWSLPLPRLDTYVYIKTNSEVVNQLYKVLSVIEAIARSEVQMRTDNEYLNFNLIKKWDPSHERSYKN